LFGWQFSTGFGRLNGDSDIASMMQPLHVTYACRKKIIEYHFFLQCVVAREVWHIIRHQQDLNIEDPGATDTLEDWWIRERRRLRGSEKKDFDTLVCTVT
jgi:hypothetical protein